MPWMRRRNMTDPAMWLESKGKTSISCSRLRVVQARRGRAVTIGSSWGYLVRSSCLVTFEQKMGLVHDFVIPW